ncbi:hypothetical protein BXZ70DRAFT_1006314 [Cristinia sonorae]|uniref:BTB domain-containing protein n=1 Tax=Cristinia sonorae TaxID=1940300 RepID=A0A8K0URE9_9AGAR|nr:hypothetical protein BXZ70DRAFT_1006314 [Cristinia sonorae]
MPNNVHPSYWFDDGSIILHVQDTSYKLHRSLIARHSPFLNSLSDTTDDLRIPEGLGVLSEDFDRLLEHLYHDIPLSTDSQLSRLGSILRASSESQLHFPDIHRLAKERFQSLLPQSLEDLSHSERADHALGIAVQYQMYPIQKALFYSVATHMHFEDEESVDGNPDIKLITSATMTPDILKQCKALLDQLIGHFTPILFTVATAGHMACTDVLAEKWMPLVIQPALENNGLCRPIETLQSIIDLDWSRHGLCRDCVQDKRDEWKGEQEVVWNKLDEWLKLKT